MQPFERWLLTTPTLLLAVLTAFFWQLGSIPLYDLDEGAFSEATREMLASGNFISTYLNGELRHDKPILIYWFQALSVSIFGLNEFALRLPSAIAASFWVWALFRFANEFIDRQSAVVTGLLLAHSFVVMVIAKAATADALLNLFLVLTLLDIYRYYHAPKQSTLLRIFLWMGLGFLTKGPVSLALPFLISLFYFGSYRAWKLWFGAIFSLKGIALFLAVALPWYVAVYFDQGTAFYEGFFLHHNVDRFTETLHGHRGFIGYYFVMAPLIILPFSGWFLRILASVRADWQDPLNRMLWIWFFTVLILFSFSQTKLPHYLLYGATPLFLLMARHREQLKQRWLAFLPAVIFLSILAALPEIIQYAQTTTHRPYEAEILALADELLQQSNYRWGVVAGIVVTIIIALWRNLAAWQGLLLVGFVQTIVLSGVVGPMIFAAYQQPIKDAAYLAKETGMHTVSYDTNFPSFSVYRDQIVKRVDPQKGDLIFMRIDRWHKLQKKKPSAQFEVLYNRGGFVLAKMVEH